MSRASIGTIGWGLFCAATWTWCIGMYLPVPLLREFGWAGYIGFALPNVLGCAAFGWVVGSAAASRAMVERHRPAMRWFSLVAIAYQAYFVAFLATAFAGAGERSVWLGAGLALLVAAAGLVASLLPGRAWPAVAAGVLGVSLASFAGVDGAALRGISWSGARPPAELAWFVPVLVFGFGLCPYLDLTFHRALRETDRRATFAVFGVAFAPMIALTCYYRDQLAAWAIVPYAHLVVQLVFTIAAHGREVAAADSGAAGAVRGRAMAAAAALLGALAILAATPDRGAAGGPPGEDLYLRFLVFFGLVFPAYVLLFVGPGRAVTPTPRALLIWGAAMLGSAPLFELGFFRGRPALLVVPLAGLLAVRAAAGLKRS